MDPLKEKSKELKKYVLGIYLACKKDNTPWYAKMLGIIIIGYALSPIDLIPDFIPILGYLDDLILIPAGIKLLMRLIPREILDECMKEAEEEFKDGRPISTEAAVIILLIWLIIIAYLVKILANFIL